MMKNRYITVTWNMEDVPTKLGSNGIDPPYSPDKDLLDYYCFRPYILISKVQSAVQQKKPFLWSMYSISLVNYISGRRDFTSYQNVGRRM